MSWAVGNDSEGRWIGYGVPAVCDHPGCAARIDRGMGYACTGEGCERFFCGYHGAEGLCARCENGAVPFAATPDTREWIDHMLADESWQRWRDDNPDRVAAMMRSSARTSVAVTELDALRAEVKASRALIRTLHAVGAVGDLTPAGQQLYREWAKASGEAAAIATEARHAAQSADD